MDSNPETRRLFVSAALTARTSRHLGPTSIDDAAELLAAARSLRAVSEAAGRSHRLSFDPTYPGVTAGVESVRGGLRLLLACHAFDSGGKPLGVVFTTLIPGRPPQVSVAPAGTPVPDGWQPP